MSKNRVGCLAVLLVLALCVSLFFNVALVAAKSGHSAEARLFDGNDLPKYEEVTVAPGVSRADKIALIELAGVISSSVEGALRQNMVEDIKAALRQASEDKSVKAIVLRIDSPGGEVTASDEIYKAVTKARDAKPVVVFMGSVAASGGYYAACGGSYLMASETTITGSIGVIIQALHYEELLGKIGAEMLVFKSGKFKDLLNGARAMTPEEKEYVQALVMQIYEKFLGVVASERKLPPDGLREGIADGRIISGKDAVGFRLIDGLGYVEDAYLKAKELGGAPDARVIRYEAPFRLGRLMKLFGKISEPKIALDLGKDLGPRLDAGKFYLLSGLYVR
jgi:protease-4